MKHLTLEQLSEETGKSKETIKAHRKRGKIPAKLIGRDYTYPVECVGIIRELGKYFKKNR